MILARASSDFSVMSRGADTVVARNAPVPRAARNLPMQLRAAGVPSMMSCPAAPWMCTSKNAGDRMPSGKLWMFAPGGNSEAVRSPMAVIRPSSTTIMGSSCRRFPSHSFAAVYTIRMGGIIAGVARHCPACASSQLPSVNAQAAPDLLGWCGMKTRVALTVSLFLLALGSVDLSAQSIDLPTSKQLIEEIPGHPQRLNSLPISMAVSPDKRYIVTVNAGYGTFESQYDQSLAVLDTQTGVVTDFPDNRTEARRAKQTLYSGLAFSPDGAHMYASMGSVTDPTGEKQGDTGNGIIVYKFESGKVTPERFIRLPLQQLDAGHKTRLIGERDGDQAIPFPAAITVVGQAGAEKLLIAGNLSDDVLLVDATSGQILKRFDLSESGAVPGTYPIALALTPGGERSFVALWNASEIV